MKTLTAIRKMVEELNATEKTQRSMGEPRRLNNEQREQWCKLLNTITALIDNIERSLKEFNRANNTDYMLDDDCKGHYILRTHTVYH